MIGILQPANLLSLSRVFLAPLVWYLLAADTGSANWWALAVLVVAAITDGLDGYLARRCGTVSRLGIALDPVADKIFVTVLVIALIIHRDFPIWLAAVIVGRDILILGMGVLLVRGRAVDLPSNLTGKYAFAAVAVLLACYVIRFPAGITLLTWLSLALLALSSVNYGRLACRLQTGRSAPAFHDRPLYRNSRIVAVVAASIWLAYELARFVLGAW